MPIEITPGALVRLVGDERPMRVLHTDDVETFYDSFWPELNRWVFDGKKTFNYYRIKTAWLAENARAIGHQALTEREVAAHFCDLPMRLLQSEQMQWSTKDYPTLTSFSSVAPPTAIDAGAIPTPEIVLLGRGPKGGVTQSVRVRAENSHSFSIHELLWRAHQVQRPNVRDLASDGVGLYRLGLKGGLPSFFIGGSALAY